MARAMAQSHWRAAPPFLTSRELEVLDWGGGWEAGGPARGQGGAWAPNVGAHQQGRRQYKPAVFGFYEFFCGSVLK